MWIKNIEASTYFLVMLSHLWIYKLKLELNYTLSFTNRIMLLAIVPTTTVDSSLFGKGRVERQYCDVGMETVDHTFLHCKMVCKDDIGTWFYRVYVGDVDRVKELWRDRTWELFFFYVMLVNMRRQKVFEDNSCDLSV